MKNASAGASKQQQGTSTLIGKMTALNQAILKRARQDATIAKVEIGAAGAQGCEVREAGSKRGCLKRWRDSK